MWYSLSMTVFYLKFFCQFLLRLHMQHTRFHNRQSVYVTRSTLAVQFQQEKIVKIIELLLLLLILSII